MKISEIKPNTEIIEKLLVEVKIAGQGKEKDGQWHQRVTVKDNTGELIMVYVSKKYNPLVKGAEIAIFKAINHNGFFYFYTRNIQHFSTNSKPPANSQYGYHGQDDDPDWDFISRGKIRCTFIYSAIQKGTIDITDGKGNLDIGKMGRLVNYTMSGIMDG